MDVTKRKEIEAQLKKMIKSQKNQTERKRSSQNRPIGTRLIRRRKGSPDKHIF